MCAESVTDVRGSFLLEIALLSDLDVRPAHAVAFFRDLPEGDAVLYRV
jgi:hypothetical protein